MSFQCDGEAVFNGKIFVRPDAQKTNAFQTNRNILLSEQSTIHTKPQLEIWADDVKCSHGCTTGQAKITRGYRLPAKHVIHTVGPIWQGGHAGEPQLLASCYRSSLALAAQHAIKTIAFPAISCGVYGYPLEHAVAIAVRECRARAHDACIDKILFACFEPSMLSLYQTALARLGEP